MGRKLFMAGAAIASSLLIIPSAGSYAQPIGHTSGEYATAINADIQPWWEPASYGSELEPGSSCAVRIVQMPGGDVLTVDFFPDCEFNKAGRAALVDAVRRSSPLPYSGFESVFQREIRLTFHAASVDARQALVATKAANERVERDSAEADREWEATVGARMLQEEYTQRCSFHLLWETPRVRLPQPAAVIVTIDRSGKVIGVSGRRGEPVDAALSAALRATPSCDPFPADLAVGMGTMKIGPIVVGKGGG